MKAIIHIGMPKVGSSSIQEFLKLNRPALLTRGIRYAPLNPKFGSQFELAATGVVGAGESIRDPDARLVLQLRTPEDERAYADRYRQTLDGWLQGWQEPLFVGSSEHIVPWLNSPERIAALDRFLSTRFESVRYVLYLRDQGAHILSSYSERIRRGEDVDFSTHLEGRLKHLNLNMLVRRWEDAVGAARLDVRLLTRDALIGGDLIRDFCDVLGTARDGLQEPARMNTALSVEEIALRRRLNRRLSVRRQNGAYNRWYFWALRLLGRMLPRPGTPLSLSPEDRQRVDAQFATSNERLRARRFPTRATLFPPPAP